jgi:molybdopterin molybdotransferase
MPRELGHDLLPLEKVRETMLSHIEPLPMEDRPLEEAYGCVLREDCVARDSIPPFDNSAMDGFAVRVADLEDASDGDPVTLRIQGGLSAGDSGGVPLEGRAAIRIMTGAPVPPGAEAVVPHELTRFDAASVTFSRTPRPGQNIRRAGGDVRPGDIPLRAGVVLHGPQLAIIASLGSARVQVTRRPRVAIISPGNELMEVEALLGPGQIRNSNAYSLIGLLQSAGVEPMNMGIVRDTKKDVLAAIEGAIGQGADAIVSTGGVSAGDYDFVRTVVSEVASPGYVFKVAMRPGKPQVFGLFDGKPLFGLPGNPAASIVSFEVFVRPALRRMRAESVILDEPFGVRFPFTYTYKPGRVFLLRTRVEPDPAGGFRAVDPGEQDSSFLSSLASANALITLEADRDRVEKGDVKWARWIGGA